MPEPISTWAIPLDTGSATPVYVQVAQGLAHRIE
ncbi:GntR family transcriptional regulator, partial [Deinococcus sp. 14RED07]|nr:GntR family transcriptional regulator [Deinococcus sp. 14RED07]